MATVADSLYILVGYKTDDASARRAEEHYQRIRQGAQTVAKDTDKAASASAAFGTRAVAALGATAAAMTALGAVGAGILTSLFGRFEESANEIVRLAAATNTSVESFSSLAFVAKSAGVEVDDLRDGLNDLSEKAGEAYTALKEGKNDNEYLKVFKELNIELGEFTKLKPDQRFEQFADAINRVQDPGRRSAIVMKLMSDEGTKFNLIFNKGTKEIQRLRAEAQAMGATLGGETAKNLTSYNTALARFEARITALANRLGAEALPLLTDALNQLLNEVGPGEVRQIGDALVDAAKGFHAVAMPAIKDLVAMGKAVRDLVRDLGGLGNVLKLVAIGIIALKAPALLAVWGAQAAGVATFAKALAGLVLSLGGSSAALGALKAQMLALGKAAVLTAGKIALVALPLLVLEDYAVWSEGGESVIGAIFGARTQDNIDAVQNKLMVVAAIFAGLTALVFGLPAAVAVALASVAAYAYSSAEHFEMFFKGLFGLLGIYVQKLLDGVQAAIRAVFVDLPTALGEGLNSRLSFIGRIGSGGAMPASAMSPASDAVRSAGSRTVNSNQEINVTVDARGATDPSAVGAATAGGVQDAARQLNTQYDSGVL